MAECVDRGEPDEAVPALRAVLSRSDVRLRRWRSTVRAARLWDAVVSEVCAARVQRVLLRGGGLVVGPARVGAAAGGAGRAVSGLVDFVRRSHGGAASDRAGRQTIEDFRTNDYDESSGTLRLTAAQAEAHRRLVGHYSRFFSEPTTKHGLRKEAITDRREQLVHWSSEVAPPAAHLSRGCEALVVAVAA